MKVDIPFMVFAATSKEDWFRKPRVGMWDACSKEMGISLKDGLIFELCH
jgi:Polynucleotide kinase 3 phosphatase